MNKELALWLEHLDAIKKAGISASAYAKLHKIPVSRLYYWQKKIRASAQPVQVNAQKAFVALKVGKPVVAPAACTLTLSCGMRLEMSALPSPDWLIALQRSAQGAN